MKWYHDLNLQLWAVGPSMNWWQVVALACLGGALPDLWRIWRAGFKIARARIFWISTFILTVAAAVVTYFIMPERPIEAFALGFATAQMINMICASKTPAPRIGILPGTGWPYDESASMKVRNPWISLQLWWASR